MSDLPPTRHPHQRPSRGTFLGIGSAALLVFPWGKTAAVASTTAGIQVETDTTACQNFFEYVQERYRYVLDQGWGKQPPTAGARTADSVLQAVVARVEDIPARLLEEARRAASTTSDPTVRLLGYFYGSCLTDTSTAATGAVGTGERADFCLTTTQEQLSAALNELYVKRVLAAEAKAGARAMMNEFKTAAAEWVGGLSWLSTASKQREQAKFTGLNIDLGIPDTWPDYTNVKLTPTDFGGNLVAAADLPTPSGLIMKIKLGNMGIQSPFGTSDWINPGSVAPPLFDPAADKASNYGSGAVILAHETMHHFHDGSSVFSFVRDGSSVLTDDENTAFEKRAAKFDAPYLAAEQTGRMDFSSLNEHMANGIGLFVAYQAFERVNRAQPGPTIDGTTPEQRFFIMFANGMAYMYQSEPARSMIGSEVGRETARFRVNIAVSSMQAFARAFACKAGDAMVGTPEQQIERLF